MKKSVAWASTVPMLVAGGALLWISVRPCEPVAQAAEAPVLQVGTVEIVGEYVPEVDVESLPRVPTKGVAHTAAKPAMVCNEQNPAYHCDWMSHPSQSSVGQFIAVCDCSTQ